MRDSVSFWRGPTALALLMGCLAAGSACTFDYDQFVVPADGGAGGAGGSSSGGAGNSGGTGNAGGDDPCGDGDLDPGEECDDGNNTDDDGCTECVVDCSSNGIKDPATFHCYQVLTVNSTWEEAQQDCVSFGFELASLSTEAEVNLVIDLPQNDAWIGGDDQDSEGDYQWLSGDPWTFDINNPAWASGQPNNSNNQDCIELIPGDGIGDTSCDNTALALCERVPPVANP